MVVLTKMRNILTVAALTIILLSSCAKEKSDVEKIHSILEETAIIEKSLEKLQRSLVDLERKDSKAFKKIIALEKGGKERIVLSNEAIGISDKRKELVEKEREYIEKAQRKFNSAKANMDKLTDPDLKKAAVNLSKSMNDRYDSHQKLYEYYLNGLQHDKKLYGLLKKKNISVSRLEKEVKEVNDAYKTVMEMNDAFNEATKKYNSEKKTFFRKAGWKIK
ncbi:YkyA family protein [Bacillus massilinigeriensis]|uniref:YkyA family protein n=1 Tax=Bacillus mediterraneensis TaxID=1805474 RepID=UPI0008F86F3B|nr:YkyA family protein [Bacillus mediterraneensis]